MATKKVKAPKYKIGDMVYSYQNKKYAAPINKIRKSDDPMYGHAYRLSLPDKDGYTRNSNWINEKSLFKTKRV